MRGKVRLTRLDDLIDRITPAYAGKSSEEATDAVWFQDHPRICGEKFLTLLPRSLPAGSPPHMRGKGLQELRTWRSVRITPAYAGKSSAYNAGLSFG